MKNQVLVLSFGRSGSFLLAHNLAKNQGILPIYIKNQHELEINTSGAVIGQSHVKFSNTHDYQRIFSLRKNGQETVLSTILAHNFNFFHRQRANKNSNPELTPFDANLGMINCLCQEFISWHNYYAPTLSEKDLVVVYETMIDRLDPARQVYDRTYPQDKSLLIKNYNQVIAEIEKFKPAMEKSTNAFLTHHNSWDIYSAIELIG